jgi:hypothetical protein
MVLMTVAAMMAVIVVGGAAVAMAQTSIEKFNVSSPAQFTIDNPCPGYEEPILVEGVFHHVLQVTQVDLPNTQPGTDIFKYTNSTNTTNVTGTGLETGDEYRFINPGGTHDTTLPADETSQGIAFTNTEELSYIIVSKGPSPNYMFHGTWKTVYREGTEPIIQLENVWTSCTGSGAQPSPPTATEQPLP